MAKHIFFKQIRNDLVQFITDEMENPSLMLYKPFKEFLGQSFYCQDFDGMLDALDKISNNWVFIDMASKTWKPIKPKEETYSFEQLYELNAPMEPPQKFYEKAGEKIVDLYNRIGRHNVGIQQREKRL